MVASVVNRCRFPIHLALAGLLCAACGGQARAEGRCRWTVPLGVDSLFTKRERAEIVVAAANWTAASGGQVCFKVGSRDTTADEKTFRSDREYVIYSRRERDTGFEPATFSLGIRWKAQDARMMNDQR